MYSAWLLAIFRLVEVVEHPTLYEHFGIDRKSVSENLLLRRIDMYFECTTEQAVCHLDGA